MQTGSKSEDIVSRLRKEYVQQSARCGEEDSQDRSLLAQEAADEIERLRNEVNQLRTANAIWEQTNGH